MNICICDMSLFITYVPLTISVDDLERFFDETFGATVMVHFGKEKTNLHGQRFKTANVEVLGRTREMNQFISQIEEHGSNSFIAQSVSYTVRLNQTDTRPVGRFVPKIV